VPPHRWNGSTEGSSSPTAAASAPALPSTSSASALRGGKDGVYKVRHA